MLRAEGAKGLPGDPSFCLDPGTRACRPGTAARPGPGRLPSKMHQNRVRVSGLAWHR